MIVFEAIAALTMAKVFTRSVARRRMPLTGMPSAVFYTAFSSEICEDTVEYESCELSKLR